MLIADTNEFHPLLDGKAYAAGRAPDGSAYSLVILRATYSTTHVDKAYVASLAQARLGGLLIGHYGYLAAGDDAATAGTFFGNVVKGNGGVLPGDTIWCDCEEGAGDQTPRVEAFINAAHAVLQDDPADEGAYSGQAFWGAHLGGLSGTSLHRWIAAYGQSTPPVGEQLWQFTDNQSMPGVQGNCDCSIFNGSKTDFLSLFGGGSGAPGAAPAPTPAPAPAPAPAAVPVPVPAAHRNAFTPIPVDGGFGPRTVKAQQFVDYDGNTAFCDGIFGKGSIEHEQEHLGFTGNGVDGIEGHNTVEALQRHVHAVVDGVKGPDTVRHLQAALNAGLY